MSGGGGRGGIGVRCAQPVVDWLGFGCFVDCAALEVHTHLAKVRKNAEERETDAECSGDHPGAGTVGSNTATGRVGR